MDANAAYRILKRRHWMWEIKGDFRIDRGGGIHNELEINKI